MGPFETIDLNAPGGVRDYAERYQQIYAAHLPLDPAAGQLDGPAMDGIEAERRAPAAGRKSRRARSVARPPPDGARRAQEARRRRHRPVTIPR